MKQHSENDILILGKGEGRTYHCGPMTAVFKADCAETGERYSVSEWWLEPHSEGPHPHQHSDVEQLFYVLEGTISILAGDRWIEAICGTFVRIPRNTNHTFANRTDQQAGMLNLDIPGGFEKELPAMEQWFKDQGA